MGTAEEYRRMAERAAATQWPHQPIYALLFTRQMSVESRGFAPDVVEGREVSTAGAEGIAQIIRRWHPGVDPLDPPMALAYAARLMAGYLEQHAQSWPLALACYNWGPGAVAKALTEAGSGWRAIAPKETNRYIERTLAVVITSSTGALWRDADYGIDLPANGPITQEYGLTDYARENPGLYGPLGHQGIDVGAGAGTPIRSVTTGRVEWSGMRNRQGQAVDDGTGFGICVIVRDAQSRLHVYGHMTVAVVAEGDAVTRGTTLGLVGETGSARGPHLHYEVRLPPDGRATDPIPYLRSLEAKPEPAVRLIAAFRTTADLGLNVRSAPMDGAPVVAQLPPGTIVKLPTGVWVHVVTPAGRGWVWSDYLTAVTLA